MLVQTSIKDKIVKFLKENTLILMVIAALFLVRILAMSQLGVMYSLQSDDLSYVLSGIEFKNTGAITMHGVISSQIMPGMPVFIGILSLIFGEGALLWFVLKIVWIVMGCISAFLAYKCVNLFSPKWCGIIAALLFFRVDYIWMDNLILTETPFMLCFLGMIYSTLMMGKTQGKKYFYMCLLMYMSGLMLKANIGIYPVFAFVYLLLVKYDFKLLLKQGIIIGVTLLMFIIPWSIRNYKIYDAFIPLTYGAGNPALLGTYQGIGYPLDESLDYSTNVDAVAKERFFKYYEEDGSIKNAHIEKYVTLETDGIKAKYRLSEWIKNDPISVIKSYLIIKPLEMMNSVFYWHEVFSVDKMTVMMLNSVEWVVLLLSIFTAFILKQRRAEMFFLSMLYLGNILVYAMTFSFDRYAATLTPLRFICVGIGAGLICELSKVAKSAKFDN